MGYKNIKAFPAIHYEMYCLLILSVSQLGSNSKFNTLWNTAGFLPLSNFVINHCSIADLFNNSAFNAVPFIK